MLDRFVSIFRAVLERLLLVWLVLLCLPAFYWPQWLPDVADPFLVAKPGLEYLFAVTMLAIGSLLPADEIRQVARRWPTVLGGTAVQFTAMPLLAYTCGHLFGLKGSALIGVVMVGCVPGAMASNVLTLVARGNVSYSVSLTASATLLSPLVVPFALRATLGQEVDFDTLRVMWQLCWMVVLPVVAGHTLARAFAWWHAAAKRTGAIIANLAILWIIATVVAANRERISQLQFMMLGALLAINFGGYIAGLAGAVLFRLPVPMRRALTLEVGMQNAGLGTVLATKFFGAEAAIAPALYTFGCMFTGTVLARIWGELARRSDDPSDATSPAGPVPPQPNQGEP